MTERYVIDDGPAEVVRVCAYCGERMPGDRVEVDAGAYAHPECAREHEAELELAEAKARARHTHALLAVMPPHALAIADLPSFARRDAEAQRAALGLGSWLARNPLPCLWLHGPPGTGKTTLAALAAQAVQAEGGRAYWLSAHDLTKAKGRPARPARSASLVVIDDVGAHALTPTKVARLTRAADYLYTHGLPVLVTSNLDPLALADAIEAKTGDPHAGERVVRRLRADLSGEVIEVTLGGVPTETLEP